MRTYSIYSESSSANLPPFNNQPHRIREASLGSSLTLNSSGSITPVAGNEGISLNVSIRLLRRKSALCGWLRMLRHPTTVLNKVIAHEFFRLPEYL